MAEAIELNRSKLQQRVFAAAEAALSQNGSVGPLELLQYMGLLQPVHFEHWRKAHPAYECIETFIQVGPAKFQRTLQHFQEWVHQRGLRPIEADYIRRGPQGVTKLRVTVDGDAVREKFYRTHYAPGQLSEKKTARLREKLAKPPDLVVFMKVSSEGNCSECQVELPKGSFITKDGDRVLCLECADLDHLAYLPRGDTALSRRARKHSRLSAVVVEFSRSRKRYERQGILVSFAALEKAREECAADADERAVARVAAEAAREQQDSEFIAELTDAILKIYPGCPPAEANEIAQHTGRRSSGRVGRSTAGRALDPRAIELALRAHIRHVHTEYDEMLMQGADRQDARKLVGSQVDELEEKWRQAAQPLADE